MREFVRWLWAWVLWVKNSVRGTLIFVYPGLITPSVERLHLDTAQTGFSNSVAETDVSSVNIPLGKIIPGQVAVWETALEVLNNSAGPVNLTLRFYTNNAQRLDSSVLSLPQSGSFRMIIVRIMVWVIPGPTQLINGVIQVGAPTAASTMGQVTATVVGEVTPSAEPTGIMKLTAQFGTAAATIAWTHRGSQVLRTA